MIPLQQPAHEDTGFWRSILELQKSLENMRRELMNIQVDPSRKHTAERIMRKIEAGEEILEDCKQMLRKEIVS